jgi:ATP-dependent Lon protease
MTLTFEQKALQYYEEVCVNKGLVRQASIGAQSLPMYVSEWIVSRHLSDGQIDDTARQRMRQFMNKHLPSKDQKELLKSRLKNGETLLILDSYSVEVNLKLDEYTLKIPCLDEHKATIEGYLIEKYPLLLGGGVWGVGRLEYQPPDDVEHTLGQIHMVDFRPMQAATIDMELFCEQRQYFTLEEWRDLLVSSMGYNPAFYSPEQLMHLIARLLPIVQERVNLIELAPKGTGKSFVYLNLSRYIRLISGGKVTAAVLFHNNATNQSGLLSRFDAVVFDEAQTLSFDNPNEVIGVLKDYLESGSYSRGGKQQNLATASVVMLANIPLDADGTPRFRNLFLNLPEFLRETAFIDRIHGILPGWKLCKIQEKAISSNIGFKTDFFGEVLHNLRHRAGYEDYIKAHGRIVGTGETRDQNAITRLAAGYLKLLFPDLKPSPAELLEYCLRPAAALRQTVRDQLVMMDPEYKQLTIDVGLPTD